MADRSNRRIALAPGEQAQVRRLISDLGEATAAATLGVGTRALRRAADGFELNQRTRDAIRASGWLVSPAPERLVLHP